VSNASLITTLTNNGTISGGTGGGGLFGGRTGGAGVSNAGTITTLTNSSAISGGSGSGLSSAAGAGGAGVSNAGMIASLSNSGKIAGGAGGYSSNGGAGASNSGTITTLTNKGAISGGNGGTGGAGGAGVSTFGTIATLTNSGKISGGNGGVAGNDFHSGGAGGAGLSNSGTIAALTNRGVIEGGKGGAGATPGAAGDAIYSAGAHASIGPITNTGQIIGSVEIDNQVSVTLTGGSGKTFGSWTGGTIAIGNGNLTFAAGNTALGDNISVNGGTGIVTNKATLQLATLAPLTITGNFTQTVAGVLGLDFAGDVSGQYGALTTTKLTTLDGGLAIDLAKGFTLAKGDSFDILAFASLVGGFTGLSLDGAACSSKVVDVWNCGGGVRLKEVIDPTSLDLFVAHGSSALGGPGSSPIPEPSTWAMMLLGLLGLGGLGLRKRGRAGGELDAAKDWRGTPE
jgi:hypothetical protein